MIAVAGVVGMTVVVEAVVVAGTTDHNFDPYNDLRAVAAAVMNTATVPLEGWADNHKEDRRVVHHARMRVAEEDGRSVGCDYP